MRQLDRLSARKVESLTAAGRYADGGGLYLSLGNGGKSWVFMFRDRGTGRRREMGLGSLTAMSLANARKAASEARLALANGGDPLAAKRAQREAAAKAITFGTYCDRFLKNALPEFENEKHRYQWKHSLEVYAKPLRPLLVHTINTDHVRKMLAPIWFTKNETARRVRGRVERVLSAAKAEKLRDGDNPAAWEDNLAPIFGERSKKTKHHPAVPYGEVPKFMIDLRSRDSVSASALEFTILTVARTIETIGARWREINFEEKLWTVPGNRMKMRVEHKVPLTDRAIELLKSLDSYKRRKDSNYIFPGEERGKGLSNWAMLECLKDLRTGVTVHGFRSSFKQWAGEKTSFAWELTEFSLAHKVGDETEQAYWRDGDTTDRRRDLMIAWANYLAGSAGAKVLPMVRERR